MKDCRRYETRIKRLALMHLEVGMSWEEESSDQSVDKLIDEISEAFFLSDLADRIDRHLIQDALDQLAADGNPLRYWEIWQRCRSSDQPFPEELLSYLDRVAEGLLKLSRNPPSRVGSALQKALAMQGGAGAGSEFGRYNRFNRDLDLATDAFLAFEKGRSHEDVFAEVASAHGVSEEMVKRAWQRFRGRE